MHTFKVRSPRVVIRSNSEQTSMGNALGNCNECSTHSRMKQSKCSAIMCEICTRLGLHIGEDNSQLSANLPVVQAPWLIYEEPHLAKKHIALPSSLLLQCDQSRFEKKLNEIRTLAHKLRLQALAVSFKP